MAFDGSIVACLTDELNRELSKGRIEKIIQPEKDELILTIKKDGIRKRLLISANPSLPIIYLTDSNPAAPKDAPAFCMLLRKHLSGGEILSVNQPSLERIIEFNISHYDEMGDPCRKTLTVELMGKYSNIIFRDEEKIIDSIKHVSSMVSSVREVLPGREYFIPFGGMKLDPERLLSDENDDNLKNEFLSRIFAGPKILSESLYLNITGLSPLLSEEIIYRSHLDSDKPAGSYTDPEKNALYSELKNIIRMIHNADFNPEIIYDNDSLLLYVPFEFKLYENGYVRVSYESISKLLADFYSKKQIQTNIRQKTARMRQIIQTLLSRNYKKYDLQKKQLKDTEKKDKYKLYGDLIIAYGYNVEPNSTSMKAVDYNTGQEVTIPLDPAMTAIENGKKFYERYDKLKRTKAALSEIILQTEEEIKHLESLLLSVDMANDASDAAEIAAEMTESGYMKMRLKETGRGRKTKNQGKTQKGSVPKSRPLHYISSDGFHIYVGKNNFQNEYLDFKFASADDWWFHAKGRPGSHVILKCEGKDVPDKTFEDAASLAAHYSKAEGDAKIEVDYTRRRNLKKPSGAKMGYVIYHTNYSMLVSTDISGINEVT